MGFDYTVSGKDKGLTYIFLEQAKKQAGFDSSKRIDWNSVMTVFDEIQQEESRKASSCSTEARIKPEPAGERAI